MKTQKINIYKMLSASPSLASLQPKVSEPSFDLEKEDLLSDVKYRLFIQRSAIHKPAWFKLLEPLIEDGRSIFSTSSSFVLFLEFNTIKYVVVGGYGYSKIPNEYIDSEFGIRIAKKCIDPNEITSLTQKVMKGTTRQLYRAVAGYKPHLDLTNENKLLKALEGRAIDGSLGARIYGKTALTFHKKLNFEGLRSILTRIEELESQPNLIELPETFKLVRDKQLLSELDGKLLEVINGWLAHNQLNDELYLEFSDPFTQFQCDSFFLNVRGHEERVEFFSFSDFIRIFREKGITAITEIGMLNKIRVTGKSENGQAVIDNEPLRDFIVYEVNHGNSFYLLSNRIWYRLLDSYKIRVDNGVNKIPVRRGFLPAWDNVLLPDPKGEKEYNEYVGRTTGFAVLDRQNVTFEGSTSVEVCDLFNKPQDQFIHVKKVWGSKTSYLFSQGLVSGLSFSQSQSFRSECNCRWPQLFDGNYKKGFEVIFAIANSKSLDPDFPNNLSYFAKLNLLEVAERLESCGYNVYLSPIEIRS